MFLRIIFCFFCVPLISAKHATTVWPLAHRWIIRICLIASHATTRFVHCRSLHRAAPASNKESSPSSSFTQVIVWLFVCLFSPLSIQNFRPKGFHGQSTTDSFVSGGNVRIDAASPANTAPTQAAVNAATSPAAASSAASPSGGKFWSAHQKSKTLTEIRYQCACGPRSKHCVYRDSAVRMAQWRTVGRKVTMHTVLVEFSAWYTVCPLCSL